jgi:transposase
MGQERVTLTSAEWKKALVVEKIVDGHMTNAEGAAALGLSERQMIRLKKRYVEEGGAQALAHRNRGRKPKHALSEELKDHIAEVYITKYHGSNNCHFAELLQEHESLKLSTTSVRRILLSKGIKQAKPRRRKKAHQPRQRKPQAGMLWQIDASPYAWLEDRAPAFTLHAAIDDATGTVVGAVFRPTECREGYSLVMMQGIRKYGVPLRLYSDKHTIFRSPHETLSLEQELAGETKPLSDFGKALAELHIEHRKAGSPQAKGRIERLWETLQDRLVLELRLLGVSTIEEANAALPKLLEKHNRKFAIQPKQAESAYMKIDPSVKLEHVFTAREYRKLGHGNTLSYNGKVYTFAKPCNIRFDARTTVEVRETLDGEVLVWHNGLAIPLKETEKPVREPAPKTKKAEPAPPRKPAANHPWRLAWSQKQLQRNTKFTPSQVT